MYNMRSNICDREELEWFAEADFSMYEGKYIATVGKKVVSFGDNPKLVWEDAKRKFPGAKPSMYKVPTEDFVFL
jgi:hypothetical protein